MGFPPTPLRLGNASAGWQSSRRAAHGGSGTRSRPRHRPAAQLGRAEKGAEAAARWGACWHPSTFPASLRGEGSPRPAAPGQPVPCWMPPSNGYKLRWDRDARRGKARAESSGAVESLQRLCEAPSSDAERPCLHLQSVRHPHLTPHQMSSIKKPLRSVGSPSGNAGARRPTQQQSSGEGAAGKGSPSPGPSEGLCCLGNPAGSTGISTHQPPRSTRRREAD